MEGDREKDKAPGLWGEEFVNLTSTLLKVNSVDFSRSIALLYIQCIH